MAPEVIPRPTGEVAPEIPSCRGIAVVVPAHDEELGVAACLDSIDEARRVLEGESHGGIRVVVILVADDCADATVVLARRPGVETVVIADRRVGSARRIGVERGLARLAELGVSAIEAWVACTDADSIVPPNWLVEAAAAHDAGTGISIGTVRPELAALPAGFVARWRESHPSGRPNGHVHGANLGLRGDVFATIGPFADRATGEDVELVERARAAGLRIVASDRAEVETSARLVGRAPSGYASHLVAELAAWAAEHGGPDDGDGRVRPHPAPLS